MALKNADTYFDEQAQRLYIESQYFDMSKKLGSPNVKIKEHYIKDSSHKDFRFSEVNSKYIFINQKKGVDKIVKKNSIIKKNKLFQCDESLNKTMHDEIIFSGNPLFSLGVTLGQQRTISAVGKYGCVNICMDIIQLIKRINEEKKKIYDFNKQRLGITTKHIYKDSLNNIFVMEYIEEKGLFIISNENDKDFNEKIRYALEYKKIQKTNPEQYHKICKQLHDEYLIGEHPVDNATKICPLENDIPSYSSYYATPDIRNPYKITSEQKECFRELYLLIKQLDNKNRMHKLLSRCKFAYHAEGLKDRLPKQEIKSILLSLVFEILDLNVSLLTEEENEASKESQILIDHLSINTTSNLKKNSLIKFLQDQCYVKIYSNHDLLEFIKTQYFWKDYFDFSLSLPENMLLEFKKLHKAYFDEDKKHFKCFRSTKVDEILSKKENRNDATTALISLYRHALSANNRTRSVFKKLGWIS